MGPTSLQHSKKLLPSGFRDLLPPEAQTEEDAVSAFLEVFQSFGFRRVKPPLVEFEDNLFSDGPGIFLKELAFRFMDPVSQRMMALRCDITAQISRIASSRFSDEQRPLRLMYANDVVRTKSSQQRMDRQFRQVGCEIIGQNQLDADIEVAVIAIIGVKAQGITNITLDISYPQLIKDLFDAHEIDPATRAEFFTLMDQKDIVALENRPEPIAKLIVDVMRQSGPVFQTIDALKAIATTEALKSGVEKLESMAMGLKDAIQSLNMQSVDITVDPFEFKGFKYYSGLCFTLYSAQATSEIGRGGRYEIPCGESACGFTVYMDTLLKIAPTKPAQECVYVAASESWSVIQDLQANGWVVIRGLKDTDIPESCTHIYKNGVIEEKTTEG